jgi:hypothetical protein
LEQEAENDEEAPASAPLATIHAEESTPPATENEEVLAASAVAEVPGGEARKFDAPDEDAKGAAASAGLKDVAEAGEDAPAATDSPAENASIGAPAGASGNVEAGSLELPSENKRTTGGGGSSSSGNRTNAVGASSRSGSTGRLRHQAKQLDPGTVLYSRYEITRRIGGGGMGAVYLAKDRNLGDQPRAVKEMIQSNMTSRNTKRPSTISNASQCCWPRSNILRSRPSTITSTTTKPGDFIS